MEKVKVNNSYELYQIITDFGEPLEIFREAFQNAYDEDATKVVCHVYERNQISGSQLIIDIFNNGYGLPKDKVSCFFDLANSSKIDENKMPLKGKLGYKGHGSKIFFNATQVQICSKDKNAGYYWAVKLDSPLVQIQQNSCLEYSDFLNPDDIGISLPEDWETGFMVRIIEPKHFNTRATQFKLDHKYLRDYCTWYTVFGTIRTLYDDDLRNKGINLYLCGLGLDNFKAEYNKVTKIDPLPVFEKICDVNYEKIPLGHYFPSDRGTDKQMKEYAKQRDNISNYYDYYSKIIFNDYQVCEDSTTSFHFVISVEGYLTKRMYDILLSKRGKKRTNSMHTDDMRYGLWACKGGIPVEKIDDWIEGGKGIYTYMQAFVDCDDFNLTANRGSIRNSDIEKMDFIRKKINEIFSSSKVKDKLNERQEFEEIEKAVRAVEDDEKALKSRYKAAVKRKKIILPIKVDDKQVELLEPTKAKTGYSESETMILLLELMHYYPKLFDYKILDYNTTKGIDFVVEHNANPKYIELKGTLNTRMNHPFSLIYQFICYDTDLINGVTITDNNEVSAKFESLSNQSFISKDERFNEKLYTGYRFVPTNVQYPSMAVICLKTILTDIIGAEFQ